jgi:hypothetical protein
LAITLSEKISRWLAGHPGEQGDVFGVLADLDTAGLPLRYPDQAWGA